MASGRRSGTLSWEKALARGRGVLRILGNGGRDLGRILGREELPTCCQV